MVVDTPDHEVQGAHRVPKHSTFVGTRNNNGIQRASTPISVDMMRDESSGSDATNSGTSTAGTEPSSLSQEDVLSGLPPIANQIAQIESIESRPLSEGQKGYIISKRWIDRVKAHLPEVIQSGADKVLSAEPLGPVDNTDLVCIESRSGQTIHAGDRPVLQDEKGEPFVKLREGQLGTDFIVLAEESWKLIVEWYGLKANTPIMVRYIHNSNWNGDVPNLQWELYPPTVTTYILNPSSEAIIHPRQPHQILTSALQTYQSFLKLLKLSLGIPAESKVRLWRLLSILPPPPIPSGIPTPAASRAPSPTRPVHNNDIQDKLHLSIDRFAALQNGSQREMINIADQSDSVSHYSNFTLRDAGLGTDVSVVVEIQTGGPAGGEWPSSSISLAGSQILPAPKSAPTQDTGRSTPRSFGALATRGRLRPNGRAVGSCGLSNLGNTCYMNSALQCVRSVEELTRYFLSKGYVRELNPSNLLGYGGDVAKAYAKLLDEMYSSSVPASIPPRAFKAVIGRAGPQFSGYQQQDSQEFVGFLLDGLSEDLNRIQKKPYTEKPDSTDEMVDDPAALNEMADKCWDMYRARNDSPIVDLFAGSYKSTLVCPICNKVSITFDPFTNLTLQLPVPNLWSYRVKYFPLYDPPILVEVDIPKSGSIFDLKTFLASRVKTDARRLFGAELWKGKIFKTYADNRSVTEDIHIDTNDQPVFWELQDIPSANLGPTKKKSMLLVDDDDSIAKPVDTDNIVVPVYMRHQTTRLGRTPYRQFGEPFYILITEADANDLNLLRRKLLAKVSTFTTTRLAGMDTDDAADVYSDAKENASSSSTDGSGVMVDAMETTDEVTESHDNGTIGNDEIEFVDVPATDRQAERQMTEFLERINDKPTNASAQLHPTIRPILDLERPLPPRIEQLFVIKCFSPRSEPISTGWNQINDSDDFTDVTTRIPRPEETTEGSEASDDVSAREDSDDSTDELRSTMVQPTHSFTTKNLDDEGSQDTDLPSLNELVAPKADRRTKYHVNRIHDSKKSRLINQRGLTSRLRSLGRKRAPEPDPGPLVRMGECLVLDWYEDTHDQHFGSGPTDDGRGSLITDDAYCSVFPDAELDQQRRSRKVRAKNGISLDDCLDAFGKEETLAAGDEWYCPRCKEHRRATKKFELWRTPDILIIHLKRFSSTSRRDKLDIMVEFPTEELDLTSRVSKQLKGRSEMYDLFGVDNHYGGLGGGHYTAYARNWVDGQWNDYNDSVVTRTEARHVVTSSAYLLFYRRRSAVPLGGPLFQAICEKEFMDVETDASRNQSPSGDGHPLGGSRNGLPSGLHVEDRAQEVTGKEVILHGGIYGGVNDPPTPPSPELGPPNYGDGGLAEGERTLEPLELDPQSAYSGNTWSWTQGRGLGRASSQMAAMPPDGDDDVDVDVDVDEDLMDPDDSSSMRVGGRASPISMNDGEEWLASRVSSPGAEGDGDEMEVKEREDAREVSPAIAEIRVEESKGSAYGP